MSVDHVDRILVGLIIFTLLIMGSGTAYEFGFGLVESAVIGLIGPPTVFITMIASAWLLGTVAVHANKYLKIGERL